MRRSRLTGTAGLVLALVLAVAAAAWSRDGAEHAPEGADQVPLVSIGDASGTEGNAGTKPFSFQVTLSEPSRVSVVVSYSTSDGTASAPSDYQAASGQLQLAPGETSKTVEVQVVGDTDVEPDETFHVNLSDAVNAQIFDGAAEATIRNDDQPPAPPPPPPPPAPPAPPGAPPPKVKCKCTKTSLRLAGFNAHGGTTLTGKVTGKKEAAEFWDFVVKKTLQCQPGDVVDCEGFARTVSPSTFPPYATQKPKTVKCKAKKCKAETFTFEVRIRISRQDILDARDRWKKTKKPLKKKLRIKSGCRGTKGVVTTFTLVFTNGNGFSGSMSDQDGDGKADGPKR